jgi:hypothetical protein
VQAKLPQMRSDQPRPFTGRPGNGINLVTEAMMNERSKHDAVTSAAAALSVHSAAAEQALSQLWETAFQEGRLAALDELQDRFCVCMK